MQTNTSPWDFWQINATELLVLHLTHNLLIDKGGDAKLCVTAFSSCYVLSMCALSCMRHALSCKIEGVYLYDHYKIIKSYQNGKPTKTTTFSKEINNFSKTEL